MSMYLTWLQCTALPCTLHGEFNTSLLPHDPESERHLLPLLPLVPVLPLSAVPARGAVLPPPRAQSFSPANVAWWLESAAVPSARCRSNHTLRQKRMTNTSLSKSAPSGLKGFQTSAADADAVASPTRIMVLLASQFLCTIYVPLYPSLYSLRICSCSESRPPVIQRPIRIG